MALDLPPSHHRATSLVDVLDRVLDKGLVIAGDIRVSLAEVELLTIRIRLLVCSLDKAQEIGLDWWRYDRDLSPGGERRLSAEAGDLREEILQLERKVRRIPIVDDLGTLKGIIAQADIATRVQRDKTTGELVEAISEPGTVRK